MTAVESVLAALGGEAVSQRQLTDQVRAVHPFKTDTIREAAERLVVVGRAHARQGPRQSRLFSAAGGAGTGPAGADHQAPDEDF